MFFVFLLPAAIFASAAYLRLEGILRFSLPISYNSFLLAGIMAMALMQTGIYGIAYGIIDFKRANILKRFSITPLTAGQFLWGQIIFRFLVALVQAAILLLIGIAFFGVEVQGTGLLILPALIFLGGTVFLNFGFLIASIARDYEEAAPYTTTLGLPLVFLGDVFFSVRNLPVELAYVADFLPLKPLSSLLRHVLFGVSSANPLWDLTILCSWLLVTGLSAHYLFAKKVYK